MLVLSRRQGESIVVNDNIFVTVLEIRGDTVRISVDAPEETAAHRSEVLQRIQRESGAGELHMNDPRASVE
jgi:carbon storage regulator